MRVFQCQNCGKAGLAVFQATTPGRPTLMVLHVRWRDSKGVCHWTRGFYLCSSLNLPCLATAHESLTHNSVKPRCPANGHEGLTYSSVKPASPATRHGSLTHTSVKPACPAIGHESLTSARKINPQVPPPDIKFDSWGYKDNHKNQTKQTPVSRQGHVYPYGKVVSDGGTRRNCCPAINA